MQRNVSHHASDCRRLRNPQSESERHTSPARGWGSIGR